MPTPITLPDLGSTLTPAWQELLAQVVDRYARSHLRRLFAFCSARDLAPDGLDDRVISAFANAVVAAGIDRPKQVVRDATRAWNAQASGGSNTWPQTVLNVPSSQTTSAGAAGQLQPSFLADVEAFLSQDTGEGLFDARHGKGLSPVTRRDRRNKILQLVVALAEAGGDICSLGRLGDLVAARPMSLILRHLWAACGEKPNGHDYNRARLLRTIAQHWAFVSSTELERFKAAESKFRPQKTGMTERNRRRLRQFTDASTLRRLINLPSSLIASLEAGAPTVTDAVKVQSALAVALLLVAPMREKNLASLDLRRHIQRNAGGECFLTIPADEVKNQITLDYPLPAPIVALLDRYVSVYRPLLAKRGGDALFISWHGKIKSPSQLGAQIPKFVREHAGIDLNVHLFRHLAAFVFLKSHPGHYETVRQLLGHKSLATTVEFYTGLEHEEAFRRYDAILDGHRDHAA